MSATKQAFSVLADNHPGVLLRMAGLFSRRGFNIDSLVACTTENPAVSRITVVVTGDEGIFSQVIRQLFKLEEILKVETMSLDDCTASEMLLVKVRVSAAEERTALLKKAQSYGGRVLDIGQTTLTLELTGESREIDDFLRQIEPFRIAEMARSGVTVLQRGDATIHDYTI